LAEVYKREGSQAGTYRSSGGGKMWTRQ
jgi:hypothetical protein